MGFSISTGKVKMPYKVVIYGPEGIGKSTFAAQFPRPLFSDTEGSTLRMDVMRIEPRPESWAALMQQVEWVRDQSGACETYVIDTADWAERYCQKAVCDRSQKRGIEDFGYGKGYTYAAEEFGKLINVLSEITARGINVVVTAHAAMRKFEQPDEMGAYDRWELKMHRLVSTMLKEWADMVLFVNYKTIVIAGENGQKNKAQGGRRVMYAAHNPCWDAKNRDGLPDEMDFDFARIAFLFGASTPPERPAEPLPSAPEPTTEAPADKTPESAPDAPQSVPNETGILPDDYTGIPDKLLKLMQADGIRPDEIQYVVSRQKGYFPSEMRVGDYPADFIEGWAIGMWDQVKAAIMKNREELPF